MSSYGLSATVADSALDDIVGTNANDVQMHTGAPGAAGTGTCRPSRPAKRSPGARPVVFGTLTEAEGAYPSGGYIDCLSMLRCRGTVIARWGGF